MRIKHPSQVRKMLPDDLGDYEDVSVVFACGHRRRTIGVRLREHDQGQPLRCLDCKRPRAFRLDR